MRVRIVGPGAVGTLFGALLAEAGHEITLVGRRPEPVLKRAGEFRVVLPDRWLSFRPHQYLTSTDAAPVGSAAPAGQGGPELIVVALRRDHLRELRIKPRGGAVLTAGVEPGAPLLFLNCDGRDTDGLLHSRSGERGLRGDRRTESSADRRVLRGLTLWTAVRLEPGTVELVAQRPVFVTSRDVALKPVLSALRGGGVEILETDSVEAYLPSFFLWQLLFLPMAMCCATYEYFLSYAEGREIAAGVIEEGMKVLERSGVELRKLPVLDPRELVNRLRKARQPLGSARFDPDRGYNSVLQALLRGEKTEVRELNERLVKLGGEAGLEAPWNWGLSRKLSRIARLGFYRDPAELYQALA